MLKYKNKENKSRWFNLPIVLHWGVKAMPLCVWLPVSRGNTGKAVNTYTDGPVTCHVDKQGQMREMDNREQIDLPQALQWPAKLRGVSLKSVSCLRPTWEQQGAKHVPPQRFQRAKRAIRVKTRAWAKEKRDRTSVLAAVQARTRPERRERERRGD